MIPENLSVKKQNVAYLKAVLFICLSSRAPLLTIATRNHLSIKEFTGQE